MECLPGDNGVAVFIRRRYWLSADIYHDARRFYKFSIDSDGVYKLDNTDGLSAGEVNDNDDGFAENVVFETGKSTSLTSAPKNTSVDGTEYYNNVQFVGTSMKNATVIDTRGSSDRSDDAYSNEINTTSKLVLFRKYADKRQSEEAGA